MKCLLLSPHYVGLKSRQSHDYLYDEQILPGRHISLGCNPPISSCSPCKCIFALWFWTARKWVIKSHTFLRTRKLASKQMTKCSGASEQRGANEWDNGAREWASGWANGPIASLLKPPSSARWLVQGIGCLAQLHIQLGTIGQQMIPYTFILSGLIDDDKAIWSHWSRF